jgi:hypothetical protein
VAVDYHTVCVLTHQLFTDNDYLNRRKGTPTAWRFRVNTCIRPIVQRARPAGVTLA